MRHAAASDGVFTLRRFGFALLFQAALVIAGFAGAVIENHLREVTPATTTTTPTTAPPPTTSTVPHASIKVLVANATQQANVAGHFSQVLQEQGWSVSSPVNATASATTTSIYAGPAPNQQNAAMVIATELNLNPSVIKPLSSSVPVSTSTGNDVVVVIGSDLAGSGFPATTAG
jgi:LytR cell envelope-related transcriptional attenuator